MPVRVVGQPAPASFFTCLPRCIEVADFLVFLCHRLKFFESRARRSHFSMPGSEPFVDLRFTTRRVSGKGSRILISLDPIFSLSSFLVLPPCPPCAGHWGLQKDSTVAKRFRKFGESSERGEEREQGIAIGLWQGAEGGARYCCLAAVPENRLRDVACAAIVQQRAMAVHGRRKSQSP